MAYLELSVFKLMLKIEIWCKQKIQFSKLCLKKIQGSMQPYINFCLLKVKISNLYVFFCASVIHHFE